MYGWNCSVSPLLYLFSNVSKGGLFPQTHFPFLSIQLVMNYSSLPPSVFDV